MLDWFTEGCGFVSPNLGTQFILYFKLLYSLMLLVHLRKKVCCPSYFSQLMFCQGPALI